MKLAIMQPYFFPYIGYWQLIHATDCFILLDDVQYMRHSWINRNRVLKPDKDWQYIMVPLKKHSMTSAIRDVRACENEEWRQRILRQIDHYRNKTQHFTSVHELIQDALFDMSDDRIAHINAAVIRHLCRNLRLNTEILLSSEIGFDYEGVSNPDEWALHITQQMGATQYINPIGGVALFDPRKFTTFGAKIQFLKSRPITYYQRQKEFEPALSIIDVLMFNGLEGTRRLLENYDIKTAVNK